MPESQSLGTRLKNDLTNNFSVSITAALLAIVALFAFAQVGDASRGGLLLALNIAVFIPYAYERYWPVEYSAGAAAVWTLSAALITTGLFVGAYQLSASVLTDASISAAVAFVATVAIQYGTAALFARVRRNA